MRILRQRTRAMGQLAEEGRTDASRAPDTAGLVNVLVYGFDDLKGAAACTSQGGLRVSFAGPEAAAFSEYNIVILPYDAFVAEETEGMVQSTDASERDRRAKEIAVLLDKAGTICWLVDRVPLVTRVDRYADWGDYVLRNFNQMINAYPGFQHVFSAGYTFSAPWGSALPIRRCRRPEFAQWVSRYCSTRHSLHRLADKNVHPVMVLCTFGDDDPAGFALRVRGGAVVVLPYAPGSTPPQDKRQALCELAGALHRYRRATVTERPSWLTSFQFSAEIPLRQQLTTLEARRAELEAQLAPYERDKDILVLRNDALVDAVVFCMERRGLKLHRDERFAEDLMLLSADGQHVAVCEVKAVNSSAQGKHISQIEQHRTENDLPHDFPGILLINTFCEATSLGEKDRPIEPKARKHAADRQVVVLRTLDLLRLLDVLDEGRVTTDGVVALLTGSGGWLAVAAGGSYQLLTR